MRSMRFVRLVAVTFLALTPHLAHAQGTSSPTIHDSSVGYADPALPGHQFRLRYDTAYHFNRPPRDEFFWPRAAPFGPGPARVESSVDYQDLSACLEKQVGERLSGFVELPVRFLTPEINDNTAGL